MLLRAWSIALILQGHAKLGEFLHMGLQQFFALSVITPLHKAAHLIAKADQGVNGALHTGQHGAETVRRDNRQGPQSPRAATLAGQLRAQQVERIAGAS